VAASVLMLQLVLQLLPSVMLVHCLACMSLACRYDITCPQMVCMYWRTLLKPVLLSSCYTGRGHYRLVQAIVEAAVIAHGPARAKQRCINHTNHKGHSALTLACMNG
jgi:hypothetical protein